MEIETLSWSIVFFRNSLSSAVRFGFVGTGTGVIIVVVFTAFVVTTGVGRTPDGDVVFAAFVVTHPARASAAMTITNRTRPWYNHFIIKTV